MALPGGLRRDDPTVGTPGLLGKPVEVVDRHGDLSQALRKRLAILEGDGAGNLLASRFELVRPAMEILSAILARQRPPRREGGLPIGKGLGQPRSLDGRDPGPRTTVRGIGHLPDGVGRHQLTIEIEGMRLHLGTFAQSLRKRSIPMSVRG